LGDAPGWTAPRGFRCIGIELVGSGVPTGHGGLDDARSRQVNWRAIIIGPSGTFAVAALALAADGWPRQRGFGCERTRFSVS
jgi:hypothetical protein